MNEAKRTLIFAIAAGASVAMATVTHYASRPSAPAVYENLGEAFYPDFDDPIDARSLRVVAYDDATAEVRQFNVEFKDGRWRIPSHHNYPADGEERLAKTAASVIDVTRGALQSRRESDHEHYGVIDPLSEDVAQLRGRGQRITLNEEDGSVLADYIVGKQAEGRDGHFYVRIPSEKEVYLSNIEIDLSTKFADWIEADLLKLDRNDLVELVVNNYSVIESDGRLSVDGDETNKLEREKSVDPWKLDGLNEEDEELKTDVVRKMVSSLDDLKILGVREKPAGINPDLTVDPDIARNPLLLQRLTADLMSRGFIPYQDKEGNPELISNEGELTAATNEGVVYELHFGEVFSGTDKEIEVGFATDSDAEQKEDESDSDEEGEEPQSDSQDESGETDDGPAAGKRSRYLYVTVAFAASHVPDKPEKPVEPEAPSSEAEAAAEEKTDSDAATDANSPDADADADADGSGEESAEENSGEGEAEAESDASEDAENAEDKPDPQAEYEAAKKQYEDDLKKYEADLKAYEEKLAAGRKRVDDLNARFGAWYYVISADSFENLRLARADLVEPKEKPEDDADETGADANANGTETSTEDAKATEPSNGSAGSETSPDANGTEEPADADAEAKDAEKNADKTEGAAANAVDKP